MVISVYIFLLFFTPMMCGISNSNNNNNNNNDNSGNSNSNNNNNLGSDGNSGSQQQLTSRIVYTKYGAVSGVIVHLDGRHLEPVEAFKGIPYASPPIGSLRFMPPVTGALWSGVKKADRFGPVCPQRLPDISNETLALERMPKGRLDYLKRLLPHLSNQSEDCLYLNIYSPVHVDVYDVSTKKQLSPRYTRINNFDGRIGITGQFRLCYYTYKFRQKILAGSRDGSGNPTKFPVMVFVHGESYEWNSGNPYDGSVLASYGQILVVTINYRLGILGFLNANTDRFSKAPANYGLMDIIAALHWLQENIGFFGGDSQSVTLAGHGTGGACVQFLIASSAVPDGLLFHRAMLLSGSGLAPWSLVGDPAYHAAVVSHHVKCSPELQYQHLMKCLRDKPLELINSSPVRAPDFGNAFGPSVDGVVIDLGDQPQPDVHYDYTMSNTVPSKNVKEIPNTLNMINAVLLRKNSVNKLSRYDLLLGVTRAEAYFAFNSEDVQYGIEADRRTKILKTYVRNTYSYHLSEILATIVNEYTDWERPVQHPINIRDETLEALSDAQIVAPIAQTADLHSADHRNSFLYVFDYQTKYGDYPQRQGCIHGEDLPYIFGAPLVGGFNHFTRNYTKAEIILSESVMLYWSNFVKTGNPNEPHESEHNSNRQERRIKNIEWTPYESVHKKYLNLDTKPKLKNHYRAHRLSFWLNLVPDLHKPGGDEVPMSHHQLENDSDDTKNRPKSTVKPLSPQVQRNYGGAAGSTNSNNNNNNNYSIFTTQVFSLLNYSSQLRYNKTDPNKISLSTESESDSDDANHITGTVQPQEDGFAAYSTALSVTIAIGCSLLILNVLIFAGVYYQRDKTRLNDHARNGKKRNENGQMPNNICGDLENLTIHSKNDPTTILSHHHAMQQHHQLPPPEFADLPQRAPPPPKHLKSVPDGHIPSHGLQIIGTNCGTISAKKGIVKNTNSSNQQNTMDELRV